MPLNYSIAMLKNPQKQDEEPKAYAKSQITGELTLKELEQQVASQTTVSRADVAAVIQLGSSIHKTCPCFDAKSEYKEL